MLCLFKAKYLYFTTAGKDQNDITVQVGFPVNSLATLVFCLTGVPNCKLEKYTHKNLTTCRKSANKPSTSCVRTACYKLSTSLEQVVNNL